ncbi:hypothetical protein I302_103970 [Kwoniella bestiolae CBS 10118]|uniref:Uncharacterized protein n=1 Tax=Kwoniella bestiolae CBS 10118 TaxID=1296100 RepID=A0A1B9G9Z2_9TREE|nr:hypothetical protein I302_02676 [Kwoniella bestiolae CBS 10118]OCF27827.1 hypothetical protein I302_02676 [Kwoniella bestiolae CBS 10118]
MSESASTPNPPPADPPATTEGSPKPVPSSTELTPAPAESGANTPSHEPVIDPELMDLPAPPHHNNNTSIETSNGTQPQAQEGEAASNEYDIHGEGVGMGIRESIASAPNPRPADFPPPDQLNENLSLDMDAIAQIAAENDDMPGSPTAKMMRAIAPPTAIMTNPEWPPPPPNASVNLFIGRALLSNGNDNWPLKPNEIVNWIRKHYPSEWDGDEGRCSAHRVRTYLARKGADMYYEKLNQGCINGWRIRANHLWRFDNGGFQGRGMKQEEAAANAQKEQEALANAARKEAAAAALAAGHPNVKVSMSNPGITTLSQDALSTLHQQALNQPNKKPRLSATATNAKTGGLTGQSRRRNTKKNSLPAQQHQQQQPQSDLGFPQQQQDQSQQYYQPQDGSQSQQLYADPSASTSAGVLDPSLNQTGDGDGDENNVDINMVQQAMQAAATQMDDLDMGIQLPIEMQMHSNGHEGDDVDDTRFNFEVVDVSQAGGHGGQYGADGNYGYTG